MRKHPAILLSALLVVASVAPLFADDRPAQVQPPLSFQEIVARADSEMLSRMLIERKTQRASLTGRNTSQELAQVDDEIGQIVSSLQNRLNRGTSQDNAEAAPVMAYFPRIVPPTPMTPVPQPAAMPHTESPAAPTASAATNYFAVESPEDLAVRTRLERRITLDVQSQSLENVLAFIEDQTKVPLRVKWKALEAAGVERATPVTQHLQNLPARRVLAWVFEAMGAASLGFTVEDSGITISTRDELNSARYQITRVIDIRDLITPGSYSYLPPELLLQIRMTQVTNLSDTIKSVVAPDSWRDNGGTIGTIREFDGMLVITQTKENQIEVEQLLFQLRSKR